METTITDSQKMQTILDEIGITSYRLTQELNLSSGAIYHVLSGKNKLSKNIVDKICTLYPEVSKKYLIKGVGEPILQPNPNIGNSEYVLVKKQDLDQLRKDVEILFKMVEELKQKSK